MRDAICPRVGGVAAVAILRGAEIVTREDAFHAGFNLLFHARPDSLHEIRSG